jgi:hypothetical protein
LKTLIDGMDVNLSKCIDLVSDEQHKFENDHPAYYELHNAIFHLMKARKAIEKHIEIRRGR